MGPSLSAAGHAHVPGQGRSIVTPIDHKVMALRLARDGLQDRVLHPDRPDWGTGQVQSVIGDRITVNFENAGKLLINAALVALEVVPEDHRR